MDNHEEQKNKNMVLCMLTWDSHNYALDGSRRSLNPVDKHFNNVGGVF